MVLRWIGRFAFRAEERRREGHHGKHRFGEIASGLVSMAFAWDRLLERLRRTASPQVVHVRFLDGSELFGVLAAGGSADFHADGGGLVLDAELLKVDGRLMQVPGSNGVFVSPAAVASVAFVSYEDPGGPE